MVKNSPATQETLVQFLGWEDTLGEGIGCSLQYSWGSLVAQLVKNLPAVREIWVQSLFREDPLEKRKATQSSILAWRILLEVESKVQNLSAPNVYWNANQCCFKRNLYHHPKNFTWNPYQEGNSF